MDESVRVLKIGAAMAEDQRWFVRRNSKTYGPFSARKLKQLAEQQKVSADDEIKKGDAGEWVKADRLKGLFRQTADAPAGDVTDLHPAAPDKWPPIHESNKPTGGIIACQPPIVAVDVPP